MGKKKLTKTQEKKLDELVKTMKGADRATLDAVLRRTKKLDVRISEATRREIREAAKRRGMTVSQYILHLHHEAEKKQ